MGESRSVLPRTNHGERCTQRLHPYQARAYYTRLRLSDKVKVTEKEPGRPLLHPGSDYLAFVCLVITAQAVRPCKSYLAVLTRIFYPWYCSTSKIKKIAGASPDVPATYTLDT